MSILNLTDEQREEAKKFREKKDSEHFVSKALQKQHPEENPEFFNLITINEFDKTIVGERKTRQAIFLSLCSIWVKNLQSQINALVNSESSAGKSYVCKKVYDIFPDKLKQYRTKISAEAFTYWHDSRREPEWDWDGKICYLEDIRESVINSDTFKIMCSEGSTATIVRNQLAIDIEIVGQPIMLITTATAQPTAEILNRFNLLPLDETEEQTEKILEYQSLEAMGKTKKDYDERIKKSLERLERVNVVVPFADKIFAHFPKTSLRVRRDYVRFLDLIKSSSALHQYLREKDKDDNIIATKHDYELARSCLNCFRHRGVFGLATRLRKAFDSCNQIEPKPFTAKEIYTFNPFVNQANWYNYLDKLVELNLLSIEIVRKEGIPKPVKVYTPIISQIINLPEYDNLNNKYNINNKYNKKDKYNKNPESNSRNSRNYSTIEEERIENEKNVE